MDATLHNKCSQSVCCFFCSKESKLTIKLKSEYFDVCENEVPELVEFGEIFKLSDKQIVQIIEFQAVDYWHKNKQP